VLSDDYEVKFNFAKWFNYVINFLDSCKTANQFAGICSYLQMKDLGINVEAVNECVDNSFVIKGDRSSDNKILAADREFANSVGVVLHPAVTVNNMTYRGDISGENIFRAICAGFLKMPDICKGDNIF